MTTLSGGAPEQAPRWDLVDTESCGGGIRFLAPLLIVWGYVGIYRRNEYDGGAPRGPRGRGRAHPPRACPCLVGPLVLHRRTPSSYIYLRSPNDQNRSQKPNSTTATFCIHEIPSWGLFWSSAGRGSSSRRASTSS